MILSSSSERRFQWRSVVRGLGVGAAVVSVVCVGAGCAVAVAPCCE